MLKFRRNIDKLNERYKESETKELFYRIYDRENELIYLQKLLQAVTSQKVEKTVTW